MFYVNVFAFWPLFAGNGHINLLIRSDIMKKLLIIIVCLLFAACATQKPTTSQAPVTNEIKVTEAAKPVPPEENSVSSDKISAEALQAAKVQEEANAAAAALNSAKQSLASKSVYFDFDQEVIKPEYSDSIVDAAKLLSNNKNIIVTLEGNADERGSSEYNLALGDRRARSVQKSLELLGVQNSQIKVVSYGSLKPRLECHEEKCWHENRRVDFVPQ